LINWNIVKHGSTEKPPLLLLHGFAGNSQYWDPFIEPLSQKYSLIVPDLPGHGKTVISENISDISKIVKSLAIELNMKEKISIIGYSMGARFAMSILANDLFEIDKIMLLSGSAGMDDTVEKNDRYRADCHLADHISENGIEWFAKYWESLPLFESRRKCATINHQRLREIWLSQDPDQLSAGLRLMSVGKQDYLLDKIQSSSVKTLFMVGGLDRKYSKLLKQYAMGAVGIQYLILKNCGHDIPSECPNHFLALASNFLSL
jgi:2-succinyl-6-hydroxy-2,4-cyclohexadiene-1-carboxylate synthase